MEDYYNPRSAASECLSTLCKVRPLSCHFFNFRMCFLHQEPALSPPAAAYTPPSLTVFLLLRNAAKHVYQSYSLPVPASCRCCYTHAAICCVFVCNWFAFVLMKLYVLC